MNTNSTVLSLDCGTQSVRAIVFDTHGRMLGKGQVPLEYIAEQPGWGEQSPEYFWSALGRACQNLWSNHPHLRDGIAGVTLTTQRATVVNLDAGGQPLRRAIHWFDNRRCMHFKPVGGLWGLAFRLLGMTESIRYFQSMAESTWLEHHEPSVMQRTAKYLLLSGYLNFRLCGRYVDSVASQVGYLPFDYRKQDWAAPSDWKWQVVRLRRDQLPDLVPPGGMLGPVTPEAASALGIAPGLPLIAAGADKACEILGSGVVDDETAHLSFGTTATINVLSSSYVEPVRFLPPYPAAIPGQYSMEVQIFRGFWMVSWFIEQFGAEERETARRAGRSVESVLDEHIRQIPPGCEGLVVQPYWSPGLKVPGPEARGAVIGFTDWHTRHHLYRAILEGLLFGLREGRDRIESACGHRVRRLVASGGGSQSDVVMQMTADIFGLPVERPLIYEASALGAAMIAFAGLGLHPDVITAVRQMQGQRQRFEPVDASVRCYDPVFRKVYRKMYGRLGELYRQMKSGPTAG